ncbi:MAG TPA: ABC-type transport auxiliary lipoprotein family protein [Roseiarcus sp.]|jgi:cholesterol transport system auxiliary component
MTWSTAVRATRRVVPLILAGWLAACAGDQQVPQAAFDLAPAVPHPQRPLRAQVHVLDPFAPTELESDRILVRTGRTAAVLAGARWPAPLPVLLQARLAEALQSAHDLKVDDGGTAADYNLETEVRAFELDADQKQVVVEFVVKLVSARDGRIKAFKTFKTRAPVASTNPHEVTTALNGALSSVMAQIVAFVAASV